MGRAGRKQVEGQGRNAKHFKRPGTAATLQNVYWARTLSLACQNSLCSPLSFCVSWDRLLDVSETRFLHQFNRDNSICFPELLGELNVVN